MTESDQITLEEIKGHVTDLDPNIEGEQLDAAVVLLSVIAVGPNADRIAKFTGLNRDNHVRPLCRRLRENGVWVDRRGVRMDWFDEKHGGIAFTMDMLVALGHMERFENEDKELRYKLTKVGRECVEGLPSR